MHFNSTILLVSLILFSMTGNSHAEDTDDNKNMPVVLDTISGFGGSLTSLNKFAEIIAFESSWDNVSQKLTVKDINNVLVFSPGNPICMINDNVVQLAIPPVTKNRDLWLPLNLCVEIFGMVLDDSLFIDENEKTKLHIYPVQAASKPEMPGQKQTEGIKEDELPKIDVVASLDSSFISRIQGQPIKTIVIDPGHGGKDPGAIGPNGTMEKTVVLEIALKLRDMLKKKKYLQVHLTREKDVFIPLKKRTEFANNKKADLFISIHANSIAGNKKKKSKIKGYKIYFLSQAKNEEDKMVAMMENSVIEFEDETDRGDYLQNILIDLAGNEYQRESQDMSIMLAESFGNSLKNVNKLHRGVGQAPFWVLNGAFMPSVLVETAFISNPSEEKLLKTSSFQKEIASAILEAIYSFKKKYEVEL